MMLDNYKDALDAIAVDVQAASATSTARARGKNVQTNVAYALGIVTLVAAML